MHSFCSVCDFVFFYHSSNDKRIFSLGVWNPFLVSVYGIVTDPIYFYTLRLSHIIESGFRTDLNQHKNRLRQVSCAKREY